MKWRPLKMKIVEPGHIIETPIDGDAILAHIEKAGRTCYKTDPDDAAVFVRKIIKNGHESVIEHFSITVRIICDRGVSHEIVRHRLSSFSQESTRYCNYGKMGEVAFILPSWIKNGIGEYTPIWDGCLGRQEIDPFEHGSPESWWFWHCAVAERDYLKLLELGWSPQQARSVLPNSLKTEIFWTANLREWRLIFKQRTAKAAHPQMRQIMIPLLREMQEKIPVVFDDIETL
jgi:thymidylate synthase (FAD)